MADIVEIKERNDIVEVIGTYIPLKQKGRNWLGLCPFHQEKTPSFNVTPVTQSFKCFGCGAAGDAITFVEKYNNMTFVEAAEFLARRAGLNFDRKGQSEEKGKPSEREQIHAINAVASEWFRKRLENAAVARDYIYGRGLAHDTIQKFQLGYAPEGWDNLTGWLQAQRHDLRIAATAGLIHIGKSGDYYDVFRHRILFPIHDEQERIVGFGGRAFGDDIPKYLNTGETPVFNKSRLLYGLPFARRKISAEGMTLLMEGYMDVIAAHQAGFTNAVATLGTSLTEEHAKKLAQLAPVVVLVYDADNAGIKATLRAAEVFKQVQENGVREVELKMVRLPDGDDPDSILKRGDIAAFQKAIDDAGSYVAYLIDVAKRRQNLGTDEGKAKFLNDLIRILVDVPSSTLCDRYLEQNANLHPLAKISISSAIQQMHRELVERRGKLRSKKRPSHPSGNGSNMSMGTSETADSGQENRNASSSQSGQTPTGGGTSSGGSPSGGAPTRSRGDGGYASRPRRPWTREDRMEYERRLKKQMIQPVELDSSRPILSAEERAENELIRALTEPDWRENVFRHIRAEEFVTPGGRLFYEFVLYNRLALQQAEQGGAETGALNRLLNTHEDTEFSASIRNLVQESLSRAENEPITERLLAQCVQTLRRRHRERQAGSMAEELAQLMQKSPTTPEEREQTRRLIREYQQVLKELKGSSEGSP
jgi:DNA primase